MNKAVILSVSLFLFIGTVCCRSSHSNENTHVLMQTSQGDIKLKLYDGTPLHRDNFIKLVKSGIYDGVSFHRIINTFMIQGGDLQTKPSGIPSCADSLLNYTVKAEFNPAYFHKKGALAAARQGNEINPEMRSSGTQFYIVQGSTLTDSELDHAEQNINNSVIQAVFTAFLRQVADSSRKAGHMAEDSEIHEKASSLMFEYLSTHESYTISEEQRAVYKTLGGVPRLDASYTVFGEVTEGLDVVDKIAAVQTDARDRPVSDVRIIKMKILP
ncbi:MAG: peptidylprolyl isomerase [Bacteroidales bacterium]|nr:peptidylprolyl isomerase [Bacteroidales bacterium]